MLSSLARYGFRVSKLEAVYTVHPAPGCLVEAAVTNVRGQFHTRLDLVLDQPGSPPARVTADSYAAPSFTAACSHLHNALSRVLEGMVA